MRDYGMVSLILLLLLLLLTRGFLVASVSQNAVELRIMLNVQLFNALNGELDI
jgi:hypothetical protein